MAAFLQKVQHSNRVSLGPKELAPLADIIGSEKRLVDAVQKLSAERIKSSIALKEWGASEGPDLADVMTKLSMLYDYVSNAEKAYAEHTANARLHFKEIRTREEHLSSLKKSKDTLGNKIENLDRKVSKMKEENKDLPANLQRLSEMRNEMVGLEHSVLNEESKLGDFKRTTIREAMSLKLGALLEMAEKTVVVAELGKLMVDEIPVTHTEAGQPRAQYNSYERTDELMMQAQRCIQDVVFNPVPLTDGQFDHGRHTSNDDARRAAQQAGYTNGAAVAGNGVEEYHHGAYSSGAAGGDQYDQSHQQSYGTGDHYNDPHAYRSGSQAPALPEIYSSPMLPPGAGSADHFSSGGVDGLAPPVGVGANDASNRSSLAYMGATGSPYVDAHSEQPPRTSFDQPQQHIGNLAHEPYEQETPGQAREREQAEEAARAAQQPNPWRQDSQPGVKANDYALGAAPTSTATTPAFVHGEEAPAQPRTPPQASDGFPSTPASAVVGGNTLNDSPRQGSAPYVPSGYERPYVPKPGDGAYQGPGAFQPSIPPPPPTGAATASSQTSSSIRKPVMIRGDSALGSKHGDIFVANRAPVDGGALNTSPAASSPIGAPANGYGPPAGASGYYRGADTGSSGAGKIPAGAFRRGPSNQYMAGGVASGGTMLAGPPRANEFGQGGGPVSPSESMSIRDQYLARDALAAQQGASPGGQDGFAGVGAGPRFDVTPLNLNRPRGQNSAPPSEHGSTSTAPPAYGGPPAPVGGPTQTSGAGPRSGPGFNSAQFVTRLD